MEWISVKKRLPERYTPVIVFRKDKDGKPAVEQGCRDMNDWWRVYGTRVKSVTHWMPMPEGPMEVGKDMNVLTNADRIRAMSDEELADFLCGIAYTGSEPWSELFARAFCVKCPTVNGKYTDTGEAGEWHECEFDDGKCPHGSDCVWWLQQPVGGDGDG